MMAHVRKRIIGALLILGCALLAGSDSQCGVDADIDDDNGFDFDDDNGFDFDDDNGFDFDFDKVIVSTNSDRGFNPAINLYC